MHSTIIEIVMALSFCWLCTATCYDYWNGDVIPTYDNSTYCRTIVSIQKASLSGQSLIRCSKTALPETVRP